MITTSILQLPGIKHAFFTRDGGVSEGSYDSLNCGPGSHDDPDLVKENRAIALRELGAPANQLCTTSQVHGDAVVFVTRPWRPGQAPSADGMVSDREGLVLGILTADCAPILLSDPSAGVIGAAHGGWRGLAAGIVAEVIRAMVELGASAQTIRAAIGPCIAQESYEVGTEMRAAFLEKIPEDEVFFAQGVDSESFQFDLAGCAQARLAACGVQSIECVGVDTYDEESLFFSYRRNTHRGESDYGRQLSAIYLERK